MPFLVPAVTSLVSDVVCLWLSSRQPVGHVWAANDGSSDHWVYHVDSWTSVTAIVRLMLLMVPLLFHSYTGTALQHVVCYQLLYGGTAAVIALHMVGLALLNPESIESIFPWDAVHMSSVMTTTTMEHLHELRRIWWMLGLSAVSTACHVLLLWHVRSTAPPAASSNSMLRGSNSNNSNTNYSNYYKKKPTVYFAVRATSHHEQEPALINAMNEFLLEVQVRLHRAKNDWSVRLEDFGHKIASSSSSTNHGNNNNNNKSLPTVSITPPQLPFHHASSSSTTTPSPFRVLMQLFAYEDVLDKLDIIFDADDGLALTFYIPQLLSFLLHGALYSSPDLEEWILDKCRRNVHFAHRCFWFLRAWCLEVPAESRQVTPAMSRRNSHNSLLSSSAATTTASLTNGMMVKSSGGGGGGGSFGGSNSSQNSTTGGGLTPFLDEPAVPERTGRGDSESSLCRPRPGDHNRSSKLVPPLLQSPTMQPPQPENDKFLPEERAMIERLMMRVKECGQVPAKIMEFGVYHRAVYEEVGSPPRVGSSSNATDTIGSTERRGKRDKQSGLVKRLGVRSRSVSPIRSFDMASDSAAGINEIDESKYDNSLAAMVASAESGQIPVDPGTGYPSVNHFRAMLSKHSGYGFHASDTTTLASPVTHFLGGSVSETEQFDKTPQFLDALIFLAENLFLIPREDRKEMLQQQLRSLECELLPSNSVYLPIGRSHHRVWRIVSEESIPISTKERVPCIVALEVVDYSPKRRGEPGNTWNNFLRGSLQRTVSNDFYSTQPTSLGPSASNDTPEGAVDHLATSAIEATELDLLSEWRDGYRNPLRRVSLLDKMTTTVKAPFDKMKTHFSQLRDRGVSEELQALSLSENLVDNDPLDTSGRQDDVAISHAEHGVNRGPHDRSAEDGRLQSLSRTNSAGSLVSLGQWSSPPVKKRLSERVTERKDQQTLDDLRARLKAELPEKSRGSPLPYGSDQEDDSIDRLVASQKPAPERKAASHGSRMVASKASAATKSSQPPPVVFRESWMAKQERIRQKSAFGDHPGWRLRAILIKGNDDLRQEQLASQLIQRMASILAQEKVKVWLCPYEIIATTDRGGIIEAIPDTISLDSLKKNDPTYTNLRNFFISHFGEGTEELAGAKANFVESLAAYSMVCYLLQLKDRHNGNILLDKWGHIVHIDFGFFFLSSPGKNVGFESAPFKLTREFVDLLDGPDSHLFRIFRELCVRTFITLRRRCLEIILLVEMLKNGNEQLQCFRGRPDDAIQQLRDRFRLDLNDRACKEYVNCLVDDSIENWRTDWYDRYQRYFVGVL